MTPWLLALVSVGAGVLGIIVAHQRYVQAAELPVESGGIWDRWLNAYGVDDLYGKLIVLPGKAVAKQMAFTADAKGIDGVVNGVGWLVKKVAIVAKPLQTGFVRSYGVGILGGAAVLVLVLLMRGGW